MAISQEGFTQIPNFLLRSNSLDAESFRLLMFIMSLRPAYPSIATIAKHTGLSRPTVIRRIRVLEDRGYIVVRRDHRKSNTYELSTELQRFLTIRVSPRHQPGISQTLKLVSPRHPTHTNITNTNLLSNVDNLNQESWPDDFEAKQFKERAHLVFAGAEETK